MKTSEAELAAKVVQWLQDRGWTVYQEVQPAAWGGKRADIVAVKDKLVWIIEVKTSLNLTVLAQADRWEVHYRSVAIPKLKQRRGYDDSAFLGKVYQWTGIGMLEIGLRTGVRETVSATLKSEFHQAAQVLITKLKPQHQTAAVAGSRGGGYWTPYKETMAKVKVFLQGKPKGATGKEIVAAVGKGHYKSLASAKTSIPSSLALYESDWCIVDKKVKPWRFRIR